MPSTRCAALLFLAMPLCLTAQPVEVAVAVSRSGPFPAGERSRVVSGWGKGDRGAAAAAAREHCAQLVSAKRLPDTCRVTSVSPPDGCVTLTVGMFARPGSDERQHQLFAGAGTDRGTAGRASIDACDAAMDQKEDRGDAAEDWRCRSTTYYCAPAVGPPRI